MGITTHERRTLKVSKTTNNKKSGAKKIICWIVAIAIIAAVISLAAFNQALDSGWLDRSMKAMESENYTVSVAEMEYFYRNVANGYVQMLQGYGMSSYINIDSTKSHKLQACTMANDGSTWFDFFLASTKSEVSKLLTCAEAAKAEGITMSDEDYAKIDESIVDLEETAKSVGYSLKQYLSAVYGPSVTESVVRECLELQTMYDKYVTAHVDAADISDEAVEKIYADEKENYDIVDYFTFTFDFNDLYMDEEEQKKAETATTTTATTPAESTGAVTTEAPATSEDPKEESTETTADTTTAAETEEPREAYSTKDRDEAIAKSRLDAGELKAALDSADTLEEKTKIFEDFIKDYLTDEFGLTDAEYEKSKSNFKISATYKKDDKTLEWAFGDNAKAGDVKMFTEKEKHDHKEGDDESGLADIYTVVLLTETAHRDDSLATADVRHILFHKNDYKDDVKVKEIFEELKKLVGTDAFTAKFEEYAKEFSYDTSNKDKGGLMEDIYKGQMVTEFDTWVFGGEHKAGDLDIVQTKDYGWHIVYFEEEGLPSWKKTIIDNVKADAQTEAEKTAADKYTVTQDDNKMSKWIDA